MPRPFLRPVAASSCSDARVVSALSRVAFDRARCLPLVGDAVRVCRSLVAREARP